SRGSAKPVINKIVRSGKSRAVASASAIPSMTGIWISVSKRSKAPCSRIRISSASAPSCAVTVSWPSMAMARATNKRMESSSSAISTRGIELLSFASEAKRPRSYIAAGEIPLIEEAYIDIAPFRGRRSQSRLEPGLFARLQDGLLQYRVPGVDLRALRVANAEAQPRQFDRLAGFTCYHALDHQHRFAFPGFSGDLPVLERQAPQIPLKADQLVEHGVLRQQSHHLDAPDDQRQHQRAHGGADRGEADEGFGWRVREYRRSEKLLEPGQALPRGLYILHIVSGYRRPVGLSGPRRAFAVSRGWQVARYRRAVHDRDFRFLAVVFARESLPFRGGVGAGGLFAGCRHRRYRSREVGRILRSRQPDLLATGAADGAASHAQGSQINGIGRCTVGANDVHGANLHNDVAGMLQADR